MNKRIYQRKPYSGHIFFVAKNGFNEGRLKDFSRSGLFINSKARLSVGEVITMALPFLNGKKVMTYDSDSAIEKGPIGIQLHGNRDMGIDYKNIKVAELKK